MRFYEALPQKYAILPQCVVTQVWYKALFRREITDLTGKCYIVTMLLHLCFSIHLKPYAALCCFTSWSQISKNLVVFIVSFPKSSPSHTLIIYYL